MKVSIFKAYNKVKNVIISSNTIPQLETSYNLIILFNNMYNFRLTRKYFDDLYFDDFFDDLIIIHKKCQDNLEKSN